MFCMTALGVVMQSKGEGDGDSSPALVPFIFLLSGTSSSEEAMSRSSTPDSNLEVASGRARDV